MAEDKQVEVTSRVTSQIIINIREDGKCEATWTNIHGTTVLVEMLNTALLLYTRMSLEQGRLKL